MIGHQHCKSRHPISLRLTDSVRFQRRHLQPSRPSPHHWIGILWHTVVDRVVLLQGISSLLRRSPQCAPVHRRDQHSVRPAPDRHQAQVIRLLPSVHRGRGRDHG